MLVCQYVYKCLNDLANLLGVFKTDHSIFSKGMEATGGKKLFFMRFVPSGRLPSKGAFTNCGCVRDRNMIASKIKIYFDHPGIHIFPG